MSARVRRAAPGWAGPLLLLGICLFLAAWVGANPPGAAPDEPNQLVKAIGTATGQGIGRAAPAAPAGADAHDRFDAANTRSFSIPTDELPDPRWGCERMTVHSAACLTDSTTAPGTPTARTRARSTSILGTYPEPPYLIPGAAALIAHTPDGALYAARVAGALTCVILLGFAIYLFRDAWMFLGILIAASPMVLFLGGSVSTSGLEICAGVAQAGAVLALVRRSGEPKVWVLYGISGVVLALTRQFGPIWVIVDLCVPCALLGRRGVRTAFRSGGGWAIGAVGVVAAAALATLGWDVFVVPGLAPSLATVTHDLGPSASQTLQSIPQLFGVFGWLDTKPPAVVTGVALVVYAVVIVAALLRGSRRQRAVLLLTIGAVVVGSILLGAVTQVPFGYDIQARYVMPLTALVFLTSAWILHQRHPAQSRAPRLLGVVLVLELGLAWYANAHQAAVGLGHSMLFFRHPQWSPPGGWVIWIVVVVAAEASALTGVMVGREALPARTVTRAEERRP